MKIVLHLEVDEKEIDPSKGDLDEEDKKFWLSVALSEMINEIDDWSQEWEYEES